MTGNAAYAYIAKWIIWSQDSTSPEEMKWVCESKRKRFISTCHHILILRGQAIDVLHTYG